MAARQILVAEDDREIRQALADMLEFSGYDVRTVANGAEALFALDTWRPDAIILDMLMPEMDGPAFLEHLHASEERASIPVLLLSALRDLEARSTGLPVAAIVAKPFDVDDLLAALEGIWDDGQVPGTRSE
jgi:two-component system OmpR family response regulator